MVEWQQFEDEIANLYRMMGFEVTPNISVSGQQIDLLCKQRIIGLGWTTICVECKHTSSAGNNSVSNQDVQNFASMFHSYKDKHGWSAGVIVSNQPFSQAAKAVAEVHYDIHLKQMRDLYEELLRVHSYLQLWVHRAEEQAWFADFVPLNARPLDHELSHTAQPTTIKSILESWLGNSGSRQLCILGDFGCGKTTFLRHTLYSLAKEFILGRSHLIPLFIPLREYYDAPTAEDIIERFFAKECGARIRPEIFFDLLSTGRFLLLLDGFDEMGANLSHESRKASYLKLASLVTNGKKAIITCRPAYFPQGSELVSVFSDYRAQVGINAPRASKNPRTREAARRIDLVDPKNSNSRLGKLFTDVREVFESTTFTEIQLFNERQVVRYLKQYSLDILKASDGHLDALSLRDAIKSTYDLEDLAHRPILLKLIVMTLPRIPRGPQGYIVSLDGQKVALAEITPSVLYYVYTENELRREEEERGSGVRVFNRTRKHEIICALANTMREKGSLALDGDDFRDAIIMCAGKSTHEVDVASNEIRTCSFMQRDHRDCVRFTHKSFYEYYAALYLCHKFRTAESIRKIFSNLPLPDEISFFLGDLVGGMYTSKLSLFREVAFSKSIKPTPIALQNCLSVLNYSRKPIDMLEGITCERVTYKKLEMPSLEITESELGELYLDGCNIKEVRIHSSKIAKVIINRSNISRLIADNCSLRFLLKTEGSIDNLSLLRCNIEASKVIKGGDSKLGAIEAKETIWMRDRGDGNEVFVLPAGVHDGCAFMRIIMACEQIEGSKFNDCAFIMCQIADRENAKPTAFQSSRGVLIRANTKNDLPGKVVPLAEDEIVTLGNLEEWTSDYVLEVATRRGAPKRWEEGLVQRIHSIPERTGEEVRKRLGELDEHFMKKSRWAIASNLAQAPKTKK